MRYFLIGKSNSGKDTLLKELLKEIKIPHIVSYTTRPQRPSEIDGVDYNFCSKEYFLQNKNNFLDITEYYIESLNQTWFYGKLKTQLEADCFIAITNPKGLQQIREYLEEDTYKVILIDVNDRIRLQRSLLRDSDVNEIIDRFLRDKEDFKNLEVDKVISNNGLLKDSVQELIGYIKSN